MQVSTEDHGMRWEEGWIACMTYCIQIVRCNSSEPLKDRRKQRRPTFDEVPGGYKSEKTETEFPFIAHSGEGHLE